MKRVFTACVLCFATAAGADAPDPNDTLTRWHEADREGHYDEAALIVEEDLAKAREAGPLGLAWAPVLLNYAAMRSQSMCNHLRAQELLDEAIALATAQEDTFLLAAGHYFRAMHYAVYGQTALAQADFDRPEIDASAIMGDDFADLLERLLQRPSGYAASVMWETCSDVLFNALDTFMSGDVRLSRRMAAAAMLPSVMDDERDAAIHNNRLFATLAQIALATDDEAELRAILGEAVQRASEPGAPPGTLRANLAALPSDDFYFDSLERLAEIAESAGLEGGNKEVLLRWSTSFEVERSQQSADLEKLNSVAKSSPQEIIAFTEKLLLSDDLPDQTAFMAKTELAVAKALVRAEAGDRDGAITALSESFTRIAAETARPVAWTSRHLAWMASELALMGGRAEAFDAFTHVWRADSRAFRETTATPAEVTARIKRSQSYLQFAISLARLLGEESTGAGSETRCRTLYDIEICTMRFATDR